MMKHIVESSDGNGITDPKDQDASASQTGPSQAEPVVSALRASVPCAEELAARFEDQAFLRKRAAEMFICNVGYQFRYWRLYRGLTIAEVAALADISPRTVAKMERGDAQGSLSTIGAMAYALGLELDFRLKPLSAQAMSAGSAETERLSPQDASAVPKECAQPSGGDQQ